VKVHMMVSQVDGVETTSSWRGCLDLEFAADRRGTYIQRSYANAPLKVQRPFYPEGGEVCHLVVLHTAGGIVGGDRLSTQVQVHPNAHALITTAAAAKVYGGKTAIAHQTVHLTVESGACLEWMPQETIVFNAAYYYQQMRIELAPGATWMGWEITRLGRSARGETFQSGEWRSRTEVWQAGQPLWIDPQQVVGGSAMMSHAHGLGGFPVVGSFAIVGQAIAAEVLEQIRQVLNLQTLHHQDIEDLPTLEPKHPVVGEIGVTRLLSGLLCRYRGDSTAEARRLFMQIWAIARPALVQRPLCIPRVW
jgi:urease accessory protein